MVQGECRRDQDDDEWDEEAGPEPVDGVGGVLAGLPVWGASRTV